MTYDDWKLDSPASCEVDPHEEERGQWELAKCCLQAAIDAFAASCRIYSREVPDADADIVSEIVSMQEVLGDVSGEFE